MRLSTKERILMIRLMEKVKANPVAADKLGIVEIKKQMEKRQGG